MLYIYGNNGNTTEQIDLNTITLPPREMIWRQIKFCGALVLLVTEKASLICANEDKFLWVFVK